MSRDLAESGRIVKEFDLELSDGRTLHVYDRNGGDGQLAVFWHHGTPNVGAPPAPLFQAADRLGLRWVSYDRPGYGGSTPDEGRDLASAAELVWSVSAALEIDRFALVGHSGGGSHALASGVVLSERVVAVVSMAGLAPFTAEGLDWFAGMAQSGVESLQAAAAGRVAKERHEASGAEYDPEFTPADEAALAGTWSWLMSVVRPALAQGPGGLIDDDLAYVAPWRADPERLKASTLLMHGGRDRVVPSSHGEWLARHCPSAELRLLPDAGHISILNTAESALVWIRDRADRQ